MCRHIGYLGPPVPVGEILTRGPHSLRTQSWAPGEMRGGGTINADGFGVAWWTPAAPPDHGPGVIWHGGMPPDPSEDSSTGQGRSHTAAGTSGVDREWSAGPAPLVVSRYRNAAPIWTDPAVDEVLPQLRSTAVLGAIRSATVGMPVERAACAPFTHGSWAFSHNGAIPDWRHALTAVALEFDSPPLLEAESLTDSAALWVILRGLLEGSAETGAEDTGGEDTGASSERRTVPGTPEPSHGGTRPPGADAAAPDEDAVPPGAASFSTTVSFGSAVSVSTTSGAQPQVTSWSWTTGEEVGGAAEEAKGPGGTAGEARIHGQSMVFGPGGATAWSWTVGGSEKGASRWGTAADAADPAGSARASRRRQPASDAESGSGATGAAESGGGRTGGAETPGGQYSGGQGAGSPGHGAGESAGRGVAPDVALRMVVRAVLARSPRARLNLLLGDGETLWATTVHHSLSVLVTEEFAVVASEPYDGDPRWRAIGDRQLVGVRPGWVSVQPLDSETGKASS